jgi:hypothetical protein
MKRTGRVLKSGRTECFVYLIQAGEFTKIGISQTPDKRFTTIQACCPLPIRIGCAYRFSWDDAKSKETILHGRYRSKRVHFEWFALSEKDFDDSVKFLARDALGEYLSELGSGYDPDINRAWS